MQYSGRSVVVMRTRMNAESKVHKILHVIFYLVSIATFITCGSLYINRAKTANQVSEQLCNNKMIAFDLWCKMNDNSGYDIEFLVWNQYEDSERAAELMEDVI